MVAPSPTPAVRRPSSPHSSWPDPTDERGARIPRPASRANPTPRGCDGTGPKVRRRPRGARLKAADGTEVTFTQHPVPVCRPECQRPRLACGQSARAGIRPLVARPTRPRSPALASGAPRRAHGPPVRRSRRRGHPPVSPLQAAGPRPEPPPPGGRPEGPIQPRPSFLLRSHPWKSLDDARPTFRRTTA